MDPRNCDARDLVALGIDPARLDLQPAVPPSPAPPPVFVTFDLDFPTTIEQLRNIIRAEVVKILSTVPRGEA